MNKMRWQKSQINYKCVWMKWAWMIRYEYEMKQQRLANTGDISPEIA